MIPADESMLVWTIYWSPKDYPGKFVTRPFDIRPDGPSPRADHFLADSIEGAREWVPPGLVRLDRHPSDEPQVVETWV